MQILNKAEQYQLKENFLNWECADCLATAAILDPSLIQQSATFYAYVAQDGGISRGAMFVDYKGIEEMSPNIVIVRRFDVDRYKKMILSTIGGVPSALLLTSDNWPLSTVIYHDQADPKELRILLRILTPSRAKVQLKDSGIQIMGWYFVEIKI